LERWRWQLKVKMQEKRKKKKKESPFLVVPAERERSPEPQLPIRCPRSEPGAELGPRRCHLQTGNAGFRLQMVGLFILTPRPRNCSGTIVCLHFFFFLISGVLFFSPSSAQAVLSLPPLCAAAPAPSPSARCGVPICGGGLPLLPPPHVGVPGSAAPRRAALSGPCALFVRAVAASPWRPCPPASTRPLGFGSGRCLALVWRWWAEVFGVRQWLFDVRTSSLPAAWLAAFSWALGFILFFTFFFFNSKVPNLCRHLFCCHADQQPGPQTEL